jgi:hypothetical protein
MTDFLTRIEKIGKTVQNEREAWKATQINNWYPILQEEGLKQPMTVCMPVPSWLHFVMLDDDWDSPTFAQKTLDLFFKDFKEMVTDFKKLTNCKNYFVKTATYSDKHARRNIKGVTKDDLILMVNNGFALNAIKNEVGCFAIREFIEIEGEFLIDGSVLPIGVERRVFVGEEGHIKTIPYWVQEAFKPKTAEETLKVIQHLGTLDSVQTPESVVSDSIKAGQALNKKYPSINAWSIDWAMDINSTWWLIDVAPASQSWGFQQ